VATSIRRTPGNSPKAVAERRARVEQMRRAQQAKERRQRLVIFGVGGVVVAAILALIVVAVLNRGEKTTPQILPAAIPAGPATAQKPLKPIADNSGIPGVQAWDTTAKPADTNNPNPDPSANPGIEHEHVDGPVTYAITPPVGGPHNGNWMTCGVYTAPVPAERAVHDLEHGAVWITYRPGLAKDQVSKLKALVLKQKNATLQGRDLGARYVDLTPWRDASLPSPIVISAWGRQLKVDDAGDPRLQQFIDKFRMRTDLTYEAGAQCTAPGGDVQLGGQPSAA